MKEGVDGIDDNNEFRLDEQLLDADSESDSSENIIFCNEQEAKNFSETELENIEKNIKESVKIIESFCFDGIDKCMNKFN